MQLRAAPGYTCIMQHMLQLKRLQVYLAFAIRTLRQWGSMQHQCCPSYMLEQLYAAPTVQSQQKEILKASHINSAS